ncbi:hypothetical protein [Limnobaculum xujianqingii]|uniref:hypothetical protein n=1 Tax=Limnobaculum xujianqingii TaxID=2738837 RepID=UPI00112ED2D2|nr:hypothetical protein [Limnobaculum xujianqingii]
MNGIRIALDYGVEFDGVIHYDCEVGLPTVGASSAAVVETVNRFGSMDTQEAQTFYSVALKAYSLISLGDIPKEEITGALIDAALLDDDYDLIVAAINDLKKKRKRGKTRSPDTVSPSLPSDDTESPKAKSGE